MNGSSMKRQFRTLTTSSVYAGKIFQVRVDQVEEPGGVRAWREIVVHPGSVVLLPRLADGRLVLVRQFRYAAHAQLWELVAGSLEPGETILAAARRELLEETGFGARALRHLLSFYPSPGFLTERMHLVEARGLTPSPAQPEADERIEVGRATPGQLKRMLSRGRICDGKTLIGILWLLRS